VQARQAGGLVAQRDLLGRQAQRQADELGAVGVALILQPVGQNLAWDVVVWGVLAPL
jgi:hypothetical protein